MATGGMESPGVRPAPAAPGLEAELPVRPPARRRAIRERTVDMLRSARSAAVRAVRRVVLYTVIAGMSVVAGLIVVTLYAEYGYHPIRNTATWADQPVRYAVGGGCASCHAEQVALIAERPHAAIECQSCHGPLADHARTGVVTLTSTSDGEAIAPAACIACHERVLGRPAAFPAVTTASHFGGAQCVQCHDAHATDALAPPPVLHALDGLPNCMVCHGSDGLRPMGVEHPSVREGDCLGCHLRRGTTAP